MLGRTAYIASLGEDASDVLTWTLTEVVEKFISVHYTLDTQTELEPVSWSIEPWNVISLALAARRTASFIAFLRINTVTTAAAREKIIVFDVNETLLDIEVLGPFFEKTFGDARVMRQWFAELILYSEAITLANSYTEFGKLGAAVLDMLAKIHGVCVSEKDSAEFAEAMRRLCPHPEVNEALERLKQAGFRMVAFTNSAPQDGETALDRAGLAHYFECQISVHETRCFKPARKTYDLVATRLGAEPRNLRLVAAHTWDVIGALGADWTAALVTRPGNAPLQTGVQPDIIESELLAVADRIIAIDA